MLRKAFFAGLVLLGVVAGSSAQAACPASWQPGSFSNTEAAILEVLQTMCGTQSGSTVGTAPVSSAAAEACKVLKASAGVLVDLTTTIGATSGYALVFDATSAPVDGAVTPAWWYPINSNGTFGGINKTWSSNAPLKFATGITVCFSTTGPFTKTASSTGVAHSAQVQ